MDPQERETLRTQIFDQSFEQGKKQRFGLFSSPPPLAIGETNMFKEKIARKDDDGKVIVGPRNFTTKPMKKGKVGKNVFFDADPQYVTIGDPFKEAAGAVMRTSVKDGHIKAGHDKDFKPAKTVQEKVKAPYEHMTDRVEVKKKYTDEEGNVMIAPKNILTNPPKRGKVGKRTLFAPQPEFMPDDYNYPKTLAKKEFEEAKKLMQEKPFSQRAKTIGVFNKNLQVYGEDVPIPAKAPQTPPKPPMMQEVAFKPAKPARSGVSCTFEKFPAYMENPLKFTTRKPVVEGEESPKAFRSPTHFRSRPTPSVATNIRNLKASFPSIFRKM